MVTLKRPVYLCVTHDYSEVEIREVKTFNTVKSRKISYKCTIFTSFYVSEVCVVEIIYPNRSQISIILLYLI